MQSILDLITLLWLALKAHEAAAGKKRLAFSKKIKVPSRKNRLNPDAPENAYDTFVQYPWYIGDEDTGLYFETPLKGSTNATADQIAHYNAVLVTITGGWFKDAEGNPVLVHVSIWRGYLTGMKGPGRIMHVTVYSGHSMSADGEIHMFKHDQTCFFLVDPVTCTFTLTDRPSDLAGEPKPTIGEALLQGPVREFFGLLTPALLRMSVSEAPSDASSS